MDQIIPDITVIIPLYNKEREVSRTIESILNQSYVNFELIIVNDGSTDGSVNVVNKYSDKRIRLINQTNIGLPATRNVGIRASKTELITFLDADDEWYPNFLETIINLTKKYPNAGVYGTSFDRCVIDYSKVNKVKGLPQENWDGYIQSYFNVYVKSGHPPFSTCCVCIPKHVFGNIGYFNEKARIGEDVEMWVRIAMNFPVVFTTEVCARYHVIASNKMTYEFKSFPIHPAVTYLESVSKEFINNRIDAKYVFTMIEYLKLITVYFNIGSGNTKRSKELLINSNYTTYIMHRIILIILAYLPVKISQQIIQYYSKLPIYRYNLHKLLGATK